MSQKKIISLTIPPDLADKVDQRVEETGAKSRSAFVTNLIEQHLSGRTFSLSEEEHAALLTYAKAIRTTPEEIAKLVLARIAEAGGRAGEKLEQLPVMPPTIPTD